MRVDLLIYLLLILGHGPKMKEVAQQLQQSSQQQEIEVRTTERFFDLIGHSSCSTNSW